MEMTERRSQAARKREHQGQNRAPHASFEANPAKVRALELPDSCNYLSSRTDTP